MTTRPERRMNGILEPDESALRAAVDALRAGQLVGLPTETVYGLAGNAWDRRAIRRIYQAKARPLSNPLIVHLASVLELERAVALPLPAMAEAMLRQLAPLFWPGPLTLVLPKHPRIVDEVTAGRDTVAVRVPRHPVALELLRRCEFPLAAPSANVSQYVSPTTPEHVQQGLGSHVAVILNGGPCSDGLESTIVSLVADPPRILRPGAIAAEDIAQVLHLPLDAMLPAAPRADAAKASLEAPGMLAEHYAPRTPLTFCKDLAGPPDPGVRWGLIAFTPATRRAFPTPHTELLSQTGDLHEVAHNLFAALRRLDQQQLDLILVDSCPGTGLGRAIMDRLARACRRHDRS